MSNFCLCLWCGGVTDRPVIRRNGFVFARSFCDAEHAQLWELAVDRLWREAFGGPDDRSSPTAAKKIDTPDELWLTRATRVAMLFS